MRLPLSVAHARSRTIVRPGVLNVAHRGASCEVAENTLAAVRRALAFDADLVEVDVQRKRQSATIGWSAPGRPAGAPRRAVRKDPALRDHAHAEIVREGPQPWSESRCHQGQCPSMVTVADVDARLSGLVQARAAYGAHLHGNPLHAERIMVLSRRIDRLLEIRARM